MANNYLIQKNNQDPITFRISVGTTAKANSIATLIQVTDTVKIVGESGPGDNGNISSTLLGASNDIADASFRITTLLLCARKDDLSNTFSQLSMTVVMDGGPNGSQSFPVEDHDKSIFPNKGAIVASKIIQLQGV